MIIKFSAAALVGVLLLATLPTVQYVFAEPKDKSIVRNNGVYAYGGWHEEKGDGKTVDTLLFIIEHDTGTDIFIEIVTFNPDGLSTGQFGYLFTTENVLDVSKKLNRATLSPIELELCIFDEETGECHPAKMALQAQWTGVGKISKVKTKTNEGEDLKVKFRGTTTFRQATAVGSLGESDFGTSQFAELGSFKTMEAVSTRSLYVNLG